MNRETLTRVLMKHALVGDGLEGVLCGCDQWFAYDDAAPLVERQWAEHVTDVIYPRTTDITRESVREYYVISRAVREQYQDLCITFAPSWPPTHSYAGTNHARAGVGDPGHCEYCAALGHVTAHPDLGCGDVGCNRAHGE